MQPSHFEAHISCKSTQIKYPTKNGYPASRDKHATCVHESYVYIFAGKDRNTPLKDFWRFHSGTLKWEKLSFRGDTPSYLEGHTLVSYKKLLLLFGGEFGDNLNGSSLWTINPDLNYIRNVVPDPGTERPCVRRHHSAVIYSGAMYVYGGYVDLKGSSSEFWCYQIDDEEWELLSPRQASNHTPGCRYGHSAVTHDGHMWIYGGMADLVPKQDLWAYSFGSGRWERIKNKYGPPQLTGHTAAVVGSYMILFGGSTNREAVNHLWCFCFKTLKWTQIFLDSHCPSARTFHTAVVISPSSHDNSVKASSMPYLQKKISQLNIDRPRPKSSPGQRSQSKEALNESVPSKRAPYERSVSAQVFSINGPDPNDPIIPKWDNLSKTSHYVHGHYYSESSESLKIHPSTAENSVDVSHLIPKETDYNFNTAQLLNRNVFSINGPDPNDPIIPKWDNLSKTSHYVHGHYYSESSESLKIHPSTAENSVDVSHLIPKETDYNFNTAQLLNRNVVSAGIDNPGISNSTEELINEGRQRVYGINETSCDTCTDNQVEVVSINSQYFVQDLQAGDGQGIRAKRSRLDPELVLEDLEYSDCFPNKVNIHYPRSNSLAFKRSVSNEFILEECMELETIELNDIHARNRANSENISEDIRYRRPSDSITDSSIGSEDPINESVKLSSGQYNNLTQTFCVTHQRESDLATHQLSKSTVPHDIEMEMISSHPVLDMNRRNRLYTKNTQLHKKSISIEPPYILILGGKDRNSTNIGLKPIPVWKFTINSR